MNTLPQQTLIVAVISDRARDILNGLDIGVLTLSFTEPPLFLVVIPTQGALLFIGGNTVLRDAYVARLYEARTQTDTELRFYSPDGSAVTGATLYTESDDIAQYAPLASTYWA